MRMILVIVVLALAAAVLGAEKPSSKEFTNSTGMKFVRVGPATFTMGQIDAPLHKVTITKAFYVGVSGCRRNYTCC